MKQHPLSSAFPAMSEEQFDALKDSITEIGVQDPITIFEGMVIDGWHRYNAAQDLGMTCPTVDLGDVDPQTFVIAKNKARRHITHSQIALAVAAVYQWKAVGSNQHKGGSAPGADPHKSNLELAAIAGVSERTIRQAKAVESKAAPSVKAAVKAGEMSVKKAAETVKPPKLEAEEIHYFGPSEQEIAAAQAAVASDMAELETLMAADDKLAAAVEEIKKLKLQLAAVESQRDGYMNRSNELISRVETLKRRLKKAEAAHV